MNIAATPGTHRSQRRRTRRAFTLIEIVVVVTIIALLAALIAPRLLSNIDKAKYASARAEVSEIAKQVSIWMADNGYSRLPQDFDLIVLAEGQDRVFNQDDLLDPWEAPYILVNPGEENPDFDVMSLGADREVGGEDFDADIVN